jgi:Ca2+/Na+ antiporter
MKIIFKTYNFLVLLATLILVVSFFIPVSNLDINFHDTYYLMSNIQFIRFWAILLFALALFYRLMPPYFAWDILSWLHILLSIFLLLAYLYTKYSFSKSLAVVELSNESSLAYSRRFNAQLAALAIGFLFVQLFPIINLIVGLMKRKRSAI